MAASGIAAGASAGAAFGPWGAAIGAGLGAVSDMSGSGGGAAPNYSESGDVSGKFNAPFNYNASFQVGGSGKQSLAQKSDNGTSDNASNPSDKTALYIVSGIAGLAVLGIIVYAIRSK